MSTLRRAAVWDVSALKLLRGIVQPESIRWCWPCRRTEPNNPHNGACDCGRPWADGIQTLSKHGRGRLSPSLETHLVEYLTDNGGHAVCLACGEAYGVELEPDARGVLCEECGEAAVYSAEEVFMAVEPLGPTALATLYEVLYDADLIEEHPDGDDGDEDDEDDEDDAEDGEE